MDGSRVDGLQLGAKMWLLSNMRSHSHSMLRAQCVPGSRYSNGQKLPKTVGWLSAVMETEGFRGSFRGCGVRGGNLPGNTDEVTGG